MNKTEYQTLLKIKIKSLNKLLKEIYNDEKLSNNERYVLIDDSNAEILSFQDLYE